MADHSLPLLTSLYANFLSELDSRIDDLAVGLDPARTTATGQPTYSNRWNSAYGKWEQWSGTVWGDMASVYNININGTVNSSTIPTGVTLTSTSDKLSAFSATTSAELAGVISDETGTGLLVFGTSPTINTPTLTLKLNTSPTAEGDTQWDDVNDRIVIGDGSGQKYFIPTSLFNTDITVSTTGVATIGNNIVTDAKLRQGAALSIIGRSSNSIGNVADIAVTAGTGLVLREAGSTIGFGTVGTTGLTNSAVTYEKIQNVSATDKLLGRSTAGAGVVEEVTCTAAGRALLDDVDATAQRTTLGLQYFATYSGDINNYVEVTRGGTGANNSADALNNLMPAGELSGYVLKTSGPGTYFWAAESGGTTNFGTTISSSRGVYTATAGQTVFTTGTYEIAKAQTRIYVNGVRLFSGDYTETSTTSITLAQGCNAGDQVMCEIDGYVVYNPSAGDVSFSPVGGISSTTVQTAIAEVDAEKQPLDATLTALAGVSTIADKYIYATASDTFTTGTITSFGRSLVDDADAATARTTLGALSSTMNTGRILGRSTAATGAVEEITVGTGLSLSAGSLSCTVTAPVTSVVGQTGAVTATQVRDALLTVDGAGSGLDADLLDGQHGSYYAPASGGDYVAKDNGSNAIGSIILGVAGSAATNYPTQGSTYTQATVSGWGWNISGSGTMRCLSFCQHESFSGATGSFNAYHGLFQRIS